MFRRARWFINLITAFFIMTDLVFILYDEMLPRIQIVVFNVAFLFYLGLANTLITYSLESQNFYLKAIVERLQTLEGSLREDLDLVADAKRNTDI